MDRLHAGIGVNTLEKLGDGVFRVKQDLVAGWKYKFTTFQLDTNSFKYYQ